MNKSDFVDFLADQLSELYEKMNREMYAADCEPDITVEEAVNLTHWTTVEDWELSNKIYGAAYNDAEDSETVPRQSWAISAVFFAGKVAGIRQERALKRLKAQAGCSPIGKGRA